jgi:hypothetical protein
MVDELRQRAGGTDVREVSHSTVLADPVECFEQIRKTERVSIAS